MKKYLLPKEGNFYKANLHMHTTVSDGKLTLQEVKKEFMKRGYSIVAFTDHEIMVPHNDLTDDKFLTITSTEIIVDERKNCDWNLRKTYHLNLYSKDKNKDWFSTFSRKVFWCHHSAHLITDKQLEYEYDRRYTVDDVNKIIALAKKENCLVSYNHPVWSTQDHSDYIGLKGLWGVEWLNGSCVRNGYPDTFQPIDDLLRNGQKVFPLATDDAHCIEDCFYGFVMVKANKLDYDEVFNALEKGNFYSSSKPEIHDLYVEDGVLHIKTSKAKKVYMSTDRRYTQFVDASEEGYLEEATFDLNRYFSMCKPGENSFIRITVVDENNYEAHTRAYFLEELR